MLDERARTLLKALIERYVADGQPVGSRALSRLSGLELSPATIRNVMADLEDMGLIASPHTSAGRVPTPRGYRFFVDTLLTLRPLAEQQTHIIEGQLRGGDPQRSMQTAAQLLSSLSQFAGVVLTPRRSPSFKQLEFVRLSERRVLLIIVTPGRRRAEPHSDDAVGVLAVAAHRGCEHAQRAFRRPQFRRGARTAADGAAATL